jgi:L-glyceraldehyde 3-phosphate reductase
MNERMADATRYENMTYRRCGRSGLQLPLFSLGFWHNFGSVDPLENQKTMVWRAFDLGITHLDLANNYGPAPGSAEENLGRILKDGLGIYRDELIISSKAGWEMWPGPYGNWGSRKYLIASCDQSLKRLGLDYVDIFYSHRFDPETPLEETMGALDQLVRSGKALYVGISSYGAAQTREAVRILKELGTPCLIHQPKYNLLDRWVEDGLLDVLGEEGVGCIPFCPLAQGLLSGKYLKGVDASSRASKVSYLQDELTPQTLNKIAALQEMAQARGQTLAQMSLAWLLKDPRITSVLLGASKVSQIEDSVGAMKNLAFSTEELTRIEGIVKG